MRGSNRRPSPALVISMIALFVALGGTGYAATQINGKTLKNNSIPGKKLKNKTVTGGKVKPNSLTGAQINESSLGIVPSAAHAATAASASTLEGRSASSFAAAKAEPVHVVGAAGQVPFNVGWGPGGEQVPGFWKDPFGTVYLQGHAERFAGTSDTIFTLPPGFRPTENSYFSTYPAGGTGTAAIAVLANGDVELWNLEEPGDDNFVGLNGIVFRAAGS
jgi:hypothetical protein